MFSCAASWSVGDAMQGTLAGSENRFSGTYDGQRFGGYFVVALSSLTNDGALIDL